jgi:hypothetical protein
MIASIRNLVFVALVGFASNAYADGQLPSCDNPKIHAIDSRIVTINSDNNSQREDLLAVFRVFGTGGFVTKYVLDFGNNEIFAAISFDRGYYADPAQGSAVFQKGLETLVSLSGVSVMCDTLISPTPGITIRN